MIGGAGSIVFVLPDGWAVDTGRLAKAWGSKSVKVPRDPAPGNPRWCSTARSAWGVSRCGRRVASTSAGSPERRTTANSVVERAAELPERRVPRSTLG